MNLGAASCSSQFTGPVLLWAPVAPRPCLGVAPAQRLPGPPSPGCAFPRPQLVCARRVGGKAGARGERAGAVSAVLILCPQAGRLVGPWGTHGRERGVWENRRHAPAQGPVKARRAVPCVGSRTRRRQKRLKPVPGPSSRQSHWKTFTWPAACPPGGHLAGHARGSLS